MGPMWPFLLMYGSHYMRHAGFRRLTVVNGTPGKWGVTENIEIQQNTLISIGKDPKYVRGTTGKIVEQIIFRKYPERTIKREDIEKGSLDEKLL